MLKEGFDQRKLKAKEKPYMAKLLKPGEVYYKNASCHPAHAEKTVSVEDVRTSSNVIYQAENASDRLILKEHEHLQILAMKKDHSWTNQLSIEQDHEADWYQSKHIPIN